jgi:hypothetical protein
LTVIEAGHKEKLTPIIVKLYIHIIYNVQQTLYLKNDNDNRQVKTGKFFSQEGKLRKIIRFTVICLSSSII